MTGSTKISTDNAAGAGEQVSQVLTDVDSRQLLNAATAAVAEAQFYQAMKCLRGLLPREERLMGVARQ